MRLVGIGGLRRGKVIFTTRPDPRAEKSNDLANRNFTAPGPGIHIAGVTYIGTCSCVAALE